MNSGRLALADSPATMSIEDMVPRGGLRDITADLDRHFFIPFPDGSQVAKASCCIVGGQGCGKSKLLEWRLQYAKQKYGAGNVHPIYTDDIRVAIDELDDTPVQYVMVDDAMSYASSREVYQQVDIVKTYNRSRHVFEEKLQGAPGLILYDWAWQRFGELDPAFRQGDVLLFKTGIAEPSERKLIEGFLGPFYTKVLWQIWDRINTGDNPIKGTSVGCIASKLAGQGVGLYRSAMADEPLPRMITHEEHFADEVEVSEILEAYRDKPLWDRRIECYELAQSGMKQMDVAERLGVRQGYVSESIKKVKELLAKK